MLGLGYAVDYFDTLNDQYDSIVIVGEDFNKSHYPDFAQPYLTAIQNLVEVGWILCFQYFKWLKLLNLLTY